jgi:hypothetical protein
VTWQRIAAVVTAILVLTVACGPADSDRPNGTDDNGAFNGQGDNPDELDEGQETSSGTGPGQQGTPPPGADHVVLMITAGPHAGTYVLFEEGGFPICRVRGPNGLNIDYFDDAIRFMLIAPPWDLGGKTGNFQLNVIFDADGRAAFSAMTNGDCFTLSTRLRRSRA